VIQHKVDNYLKAVRDLGFAGVEMSEDTMKPLETGYREELIARALGMGLKVMTEMGARTLTSLSMRTKSARRSCATSNLACRRFISRAAKSRR
jgi:phosphosulfolactate synthase (CoM biosynthesis protein A)